jgi:hypothetical protein
MLYLIFVRLAGWMARPPEAVTRTSDGRPPWLVGVVYDPHVIVVTTAAAWAAAWAVDEAR